MAKITLHDTEGLNALTTDSARVRSADGLAHDPIPTFLKSEDVAIHAFYEVHPRRIGETIHGAPVQSMDTWNTRTGSSPILLGAVGQPGGFGAKAPDSGRA